MKIELKKVKAISALSEDTAAFTADVYIDDRKVGYVNNSGTGGRNFVLPYPPLERNSELIKQATDYVESLPPVPYKGLDLRMNMDFFIGRLLQEYLKDEESRKFQKKLDKYMLDSIVYGQGDECYRVRFDFPI
ncbi:MAG TPA: hypothetical protein VEA58_02800, partial [Anaerovoracaceae bacterium]|nr:hypothetical protein [Anaerovoracaceae bacterium]